VDFAETQRVNLEQPPFIKVSSNFLSEALQRLVKNYEIGFSRSNSNFELVPMTNLRRRSGESWHTVRLRSRLT